MTETFYWHDYETSGTDPALDRPVQFAGLRTDQDFNIIGKPLVSYCKLPDDILAHPAACTVTGLSPQAINAQGLPEADFIKQIHRELMQANTCTVGYNSIRFDDEFTRFSLYRNFYDAYEREYRNGNSRWDLIDVVRLCCALRPDDIEWPTHETGLPSFRLEMLTAANGIKHSAAHDALSDVTATIDLAKILRQRKPRLLDYALSLRKKKDVARVLNVGSNEPVLHVSSKLPSEFFCTTLMLPVAVHPNNNNGVICVDLRHNPQVLFDLSAAEITAQLYKPASQRTADDPVIPLKTIHINRCPVVATQKLLDERAAQRVQLDKAVCDRHLAMLSKETQWQHKLNDIFALPVDRSPVVAENALYSGGFFNDSDRALMRDLRLCEPSQLSERSWCFDDARLNEMLFLYRARNYPNTLNESEAAQWREHCQQRLLDGSVFGLEAFKQELATVELKADLRAELEQYLYATEKNLKP